MLGMRRKKSKIGRGECEMRVHRDVERQHGREKMEGKKREMRGEKKKKSSRLYSLGSLF